MEFLKSIAFAIVASAISVGWILALEYIKSQPPLPPKVALMTVIAVLTIGCVIVSILDVALDLRDRRKRIASLPSSLEHHEEQS